MKKIFFLLLASTLLFTSCKKDAKFAVDPTAIDCTYAGCDEDLTLQNLSGTWTVTIEPASTWITLSKSEGTETDETVNVKVAMNTSSNARKATLAFTCSGVTVDVTVNQDGVPDISGDYVLQFVDGCGMYLSNNWQRDTLNGNVWITTPEKIEPTTINTKFSICKFMASYTPAQPQPIVEFDKNGLVYKPISRGIYDGDSIWQVPYAVKGDDVWPLKDGAILKLIDGDLDGSYLFDVEDETGRKIPDCSLAFAILLEVYDFEEGTVDWLETPYFTKKANAKGLKKATSGRKLDIIYEVGEYAGSIKNMKMKKK